MRIFATVAALVATTLMPLSASADDYDPQSVDACLASRPGSVLLADATDGVDAVCIPWGETVFHPVLTDHYYWGAIYDAPLYLNGPGVTESHVYVQDPMYLPYDEAIAAGVDVWRPGTEPEAPTDLSAFLVDTGTATTAAFVATPTASGPVAVVRHAKAAGARAYVTRCGTHVVKSRYLKVRIHARPGTVCRVRSVNAAGTSTWSKRVVVRKPRSVLA